MRRRFKGLRAAEPRSRYDAVVVGAGIGGLICANLLARQGLAVLLVEQHYMVGGYCSTFRRRGYTFDASTHFYPLLGNPETLTGKLLAELGIRTRWVKMDPVDTFHFPDGSRFEVPAEFDSYLERVKAAFPEESAAVDRFFAAVDEAYEYGLLYYFRGRDTERLDPYRSMTLRDALDRYIRDPRLKLLLTADCAHWGSPPCRTSFVFDSMLRLSYFLGNYYPVDGSQAFADELALRFEERGGHLLMSTRVERIEVEEGRARAIAAETLRGGLAGRRRIEAGAVISNGDLLLTLEELLPRAAVDPDYLSAVRRLRPSMPCFLVHIGLRDVSGEVLERAQGYYWSSWDPDRVGRLDGMRCKIFAPTLYEPRLAPPGGQIVILQKVLEMDYERVEDWPEHKRRIEETLVAHLEAAVPGIGARTLVRLSASARTAHNFTLNRSGSMLGWEMSPDQLGDRRPAIRGPVENLYFTGHWTQPGGGITPVIISAMQAALAVSGGGSERALGFTATGVAGGVLAGRDR